MKRIALIVLGIILSLSAQAQLFTTTSSYQTIEVEPEKPKVPRIPLKFEFYAKVGANIMSADWNALYWDPEPNERISGKSKFGVDFTFGFLSHFRPSNPSNFYWGAEVSLSQVGGGFNEFTCTNSYYKDTYIYPSTSFADWGAAISPTIGWKKEVAKNISLDLHFNPGFFFKFKDKFIDYYYSDGSYQYGGNDWIDYRECVSFKGGVGVWFNNFIVDVSYRHITLFDGYSCINYSNVIISLGYRF